MTRPSGKSSIRSRQTTSSAWQKLVKDRQDIDIDTDFIFDTQAKRLHEYKRQMLNALHIQVLYNRIMDDPNFTMPPRIVPLRRQGRPGLYAGQADHPLHQRRWPS